MVQATKNMMVDLQKHGKTVLVDSMTVVIYCLYRCVIQRLLPYTQYEESSTRRGGVVGTLRNCCFDHGTELNHLCEV